MTSSLSIVKKQEGHRLEATEGAERIGSTKQSEACYGGTET